MSTNLNNQAGRVDIHNNRATISFTRLLKHPPEKVWHALTTPAEFNAWYSGTAKIDPRVGGIFEVITGPGFHWTGKILTFDTPRCFEYEHNHEPCNVMPTGAETIVRWELTPDPQGTRLHFSQTRLKSNFGFAPAMHVFLERLESVLDGVAPADFLTRFREVTPLYPVWHADEESPFM